MQPGSVPESPQPAAGWPPATAGSRGPAPIPAEDLPAPARSRTGLIVLVAILVQLVVVGAGDNQWVAERLTDHALDHPNSLTADLALSVLTFQWRFTPAAGDRYHALYGQFALLGVLIIVTAILVAVAAGGAARFGRTFLGTWTGVLAAGVLGAIVRGLVVDSRLLPSGTSRVRTALFSGYGPSVYVVFAALVLGFLVALGAGITAALVRRPADTPAHPDAVPVGGPTQDTQYAPAGNSPYPPPAAPYPPAPQFQPGQQYQPYQPGQPYQHEDAPTTAFDRSQGGDGDATQQFQPARRGETEPAEQPEIPERSTGAEPTRELPAVDDPQRRPDW